MVGKGEEGKVWWERERKGPVHGSLQGAPSFLDLREFWEERGLGVKGWGGWRIESAGSEEGTER
jgi:hypothetical protein